MMNNFEDNFYIFRQLFYPEFPAERSDDESIGLGVGEHTDYGFLTMITADRGGLEIEVDGDWKEIKMIDDYRVCNIGDMLAHWSGTLKATPHRVRRLKGARHSVAYFFEPSLDSIITPLKRQGQKSDSRPIHYGAYLESKYAYSYPDENNHK